ncbi:hypothetical protein CAEBREN_17687 [Caenorhabditis brenneri]|uniref:Uncharacterized protein n=1 Tax=Caenorhabditis brenneri TaxID=135651 RepID=G0MQW5_CAEBE|nr:hypothetical protein CAEBREN_17687 [Caenorhabditis brenneri]
MKFLQLLAELENEVIKGGAHLELLQVRFSEVKKTKIVGITMIQMVSAIKMLEEKFDIDIGMFYKIPKEYDFLMEYLKKQHYKKTGKERMDQYNFFKKLNEEGSSFKGIAVNLEDIIILDNYSDLLKLGDFLKSVKYVLDRVIKFIRYLRSVAIVSANMLDFEAPVHIFMLILLIPLHKKYCGQDPLPDDLSSFIGGASVYSKTSDQILTIPENSPIPLHLQLIFKVLRDPQKFYEKSEIRKEMRLSSKQADWDALDHFLSIFFPSSDEKETWCKVDLEDFSDYRVQLKAALAKCQKAIRIGDHSEQDETKLTKHVKDSFDDAFKNISTWEIALKILKKCFPKEETPTSPLNPETPTDPTPHLPTFSISSSPPLSPVAISDNMILQPLDSNAPRYELVPVGPAPTDWENDPAWSQNEYSMNDTVSYKGNEYLLLR